MYFVHIMYPTSASGRFDLEHYTQVHVPLGIGLLWKCFQVKPERVTLQTDTFGVDRTAKTSPYAVISTVYFATRADAECFIAVFERPREAAILTADWRNFTDEDPVVVLGSTATIDVDTVISQSHTVIEKAFASNET